MTGMGAAWRHMRTDRSVVSSKLDRGTVRRVLTFSRPHRSLIFLFLVVTVFDAALVVVNPLLIGALIDDGILAGDATVVAWLAVAMAVTALVDALLGVGGGFLSSRI